MEVSWTCYMKVSQTFETFLKRPNIRNINCTSIDFFFLSLSPSWHLLVQGQQWKHQNNVWTLKRFQTLSWCFHCSLWTSKSRLSYIYFHRHWRLTGKQGKGVYHQSSSLTPPSTCEESNIYLQLFIWEVYLRFVTHFSPMFHFYNFWKHQKTVGFLTFSGGIKMKHWGLEYLLLLDEIYITLGICVWLNFTLYLIANLIFRMLLLICHWQPVNLNSH